MGTSLFFDNKYFLHDMFEFIWNVHKHHLQHFFFPLRASFCVCDMYANHEVCVNSVNDLLDLVACVIHSFVMFLSLFSLCASIYICCCFGHVIKIPMSTFTKLLI